MTSGQKIAFSLLTTICLFVGCVLTLNSTLFDQVETKFYTQSKIKETTDEVNKLSESCETYINEILEIISKGENAWVKNDSVLSYYAQNPSEKQINERRNLTEQLFRQIPSLNGIRIIDINGRNVHYSSFDDTDIFKVSGITKVYKNYTNIEQDADELLFDFIKKNYNPQSAKLIFDEEKDRIVLSVPFVLQTGLNSGICLFYFNIFDLQNDLISKSRLEIGQNITMYALQNGDGTFVFGIPFNNHTSEKKLFRESIVKVLGSRGDLSSPLLPAITTPQKLLQKEDCSFYVLISSTRSDNVKVSAIYNSTLFELSSDFKLLIYICVFITILLIVFIIFSFIRDPVKTLQKRIKKVQIALLEDYLENKEKKEWKSISAQLRQRKKDFTEEIIRSLHVRSKKRKSQLNEYLDKNWEEIFTIFDTKSIDLSGDSTESATTNINATPIVASSTELTGASIEEIRRVIEEVLQSHKFVATTSRATNVGNANSTSDVSDVEEIDEVEEILDDVEKLDDVEEVLDDVDEIDEVEELADDVDELSEEFDDVEEVEELDEELSEEDLENVEEVEELVDDVEELSEETFEDVEEVENIEELDDDIDNVEEICEDADELDEAENVEEILEDIEELPDDVEELEDLEEEVISTENEFSIPAVLLPPANYEYKVSNDTYFETDDFATVENLYAEELSLGGQYKPSTQVQNDYETFEVFPFTTYKTESQSESTIEELSDAYFSMTDFADNIEEIDELEEENNVIVENDGVYSITTQLDLSQAKQNQNKELKALVDSVL